MPASPVDVENGHVTDEGYEEDNHEDGRDGDVDTDRRLPAEGGAQAGIGSSMCNLGRINFLQYGLVLLSSWIYI